MTSKVTVFDHSMRPLTELQVNTNRTWVLNDVGKCDITISTSDPKCTLQNLEYGNLIHIQHIPTVEQDGTVHGKLPNWTGWIMRGRGWSGDGEMTFTAYSAESILMARPMPYTTIKGTPRKMFTDILQEVAALNTSITIQPGILEDDNKQYTDDLKVSAYEHIAKLHNKSNMSWSVTGDIDHNGNLVLYANLFYKTGIDTGIELNNLNSEKPTGNLLTEEGAPMTVINGISQSNTDRQRYIMQAVNETALGRFGYFGTNMIFSGLHDPSGVRQAAQTQVDIFGYPIRKTSRAALDFGVTFNYIAPGNTLITSDKHVGFNPNGGFGFTARARILDMAYNDTANKVPMTLEIL